VQDRPTAIELLDAVAVVLEDEVLDAVDGGLRHRVRVAANLCRIVQRELALGPAMVDSERHAIASLLGTDGDLDELNARLAAALENGDEELARVAYPLLVASVHAKLAVNKPGYADKVVPA
jgi:hypothetical protein